MCEMPAYFFEYGPHAGRLMSWVISRAMKSRSNGLAGPAAKPVAQHNINATSPMVFLIKSDTWIVNSDERSPPGEGERVPALEQITLQQIFRRSQTFSLVTPTRMAHRICFNAPGCDKIFCRS